MLDLIIPVFKNKPGLYRTLLSIGMDYPQNSLYITIVDDDSNENYNDIIGLFQHLYPIRVLALSENRGPGYARQYGLEHTKEPYVSFVDCGDTYSTPLMLHRMMQTVDHNPDIVFFSWAHGEELKNGEVSFIPPVHNRMHGKLYQRKFLEDHKISFSSKITRANEDIGFNMNCRLCANSYSRDHKCNAIFMSDDMAIIWRYNEDSITRKNECSFYYKEQALGLAVCGGEAIDNGILNNADEHLVLSEIYSTMCTLYTFWLSTKNRRPEFLDECTAGCLYFYKNYFKKVLRHNPDIMRLEWYKTLRDELSSIENPICDKMISFDLLGWLNYLEEIDHH